MLVVLLWQQSRVIRPFVKEAFSDRTRLTAYFFFFSLFSNESVAFEAKIDDYAKDDGPSVV